MRLLHWKKCFEDSLAGIPITNGDGQEVEVMHSALVSEADEDISIPSRHVCCHVQCHRECPARVQQLRNALTAGKLHR